MADEKEKKVSGWVVGAVATETQPVLVNEDEEKQLNLYEALAEILNNQKKLMKLL